MMTTEVLNHGLDIPILGLAAWVDADQFMALGITTDIRKGMKSGINTPRAGTVTENGLLLRRFRA